MLTLKERLAKMKAASADRIPAETRAIMGQATQALRDSGILSKLPAVGTTLPAFSLPDSDGTVVHSSDLLARGPLVLTFYRGLW